MFHVKHARAPPATAAVRADEVEAEDLCDSLEHLGAPRLTLGLGIDIESVRSIGLAIA